MEKTDVLPPAPVLAGKYRLGRLLGEGGMGTVYEAEHTGLGSRVAVKLLTERFAEDQDALERFKREARASAAVRHDNVVRVTDTGTDEEGVPFLVMELLEGESLNAVLKRRRRLEPEAAAAIANEVLDGLAAAHDKGIIHRDLKPGNVFLASEPDGTQKAKILDFGISKFGDEAVTRELTAEGAVVGTPQYMPPEQVAGKKDLDARADVYAVGVLLYRMVTGRLPFNGETPQKLYEAILRGDPAPPRAIRTDVSPELDEVILTAMAGDRKSRYPDAQSMQRALEQAVPSMPDRIPTLTSPPSSSGLVAGDPSAAPTVKAAPGARSDSRGSARPVAGTPPAVTPSGRGRPKTWQIAVVAVAAVAALGVVFWSLQRGGGVGEDAGDSSDSSQGSAAEGAAGAGAADPAVPTGEPVVFGVPDYAPAKEVQADHRSTADYLQRRLGRPVEIRVLDQTLGLVDPLAKGEVQLAALSPTKYLRATKELPGLELLAMPVRHGGPSYQGLILARSNSSVETLGDFEGKIFCFVGETSTSGYVYPRAIFRRAGIDPDSGFKATRFTGDHLKSLKYLHNGTCDGAAVYANMLHTEAAEHGMHPNEFLIVEKTGKIPYDAYVAPPGQPKELTDKLRRALLALDPGSDLAARVFDPDDDIVGFTAVEDSAFDPVREIEDYLDDTE